MCTWEQYCRFAREPESWRVDVDARVTFDGTVWEVEPDMAGETVTLLWGLFDDEIFAEFAGETWGPYYPVSGPVPLHRYRAFRQGKAAERADRIHAQASQLGVPSPGVISGWSVRARRLSMSCHISLLFPLNLNTSTPRRLRQNWPSPVTRPSLWPECQTKIGCLLTAFWRTPSSAVKYSPASGLIP